MHSSYLRNTNTKLQSFWSVSNVCNKNICDAYDTYKCFDAPTVCQTYITTVRLRLSYSKQTLDLFCLHCTHLINCVKLPNEMSSTDANDMNSQTSRKC